MRASTVQCRIENIRLIQQEDSNTHGLPACAFTSCVKCEKDGSHTILTSRLLFSVQTCTVLMWLIGIKSIVGSSTNDLHVMLDTTKLQAQSSEYGETKISRKNTRACKGLNSKTSLVQAERTACHA